MRGLWTIRCRSFHPCSPPNAAIPALTFSDFRSTICTVFNRPNRSSADNALSKQVMTLQYVRLMHKIRHARRSQPRIAADWWILKGFWVEPVRYYASVHRFVTQFVSTRLPEMHAGMVTKERVSLGRVSSVISFFLGNENLSVADFSQELRRKDVHEFYVSLGCLRACGFPWRGTKNLHRSRRATEAKWAYKTAPGSMAVSVLPGCVGKLVYIRRKVEVLDCSAVSASIDTNIYFSMKYGMCWYAVRVHNFCRPMGSPEACCERIGSAMNHLTPKRKN